MKKTIIAAFLIVVVIAAGALIIPGLGSMSHKEIKREVSLDRPALPGYNEVGRIVFRPLMSQI